jgi:hypothetical protein
MRQSSRLPTWSLLTLGALGLAGLLLGLNGILMTGSFAVAGPAASDAARTAHWERIQLWYDGLALGSLALIGGVAVALIGRSRRAKATPGANDAA